jgi:hypothetical protein
MPGVALNIARDINFKLGGQIRPININMVKILFKKDSLFISFFV